jgi:hypothetical protein
MIGWQFTNSFDIGFCKQSLDQDDFYLLCLVHYQRARCVLGKIDRLLDSLTFANGQECQPGVFETDCQEQLQLARQHLEWALKGNEEMR